MAPKQILPGSRKLNCIDLFSGCGGMSLGARFAGFNITAAVEINPVASLVYRLNFPETLLLTKDIRQLCLDELLLMQDLGKIDIITACPPIECIDKDGSVFTSPIQILEAWYNVCYYFKPKVVLIETTAHLNLGESMAWIRKKLLNNGYELSETVQKERAFGDDPEPGRIILVGFKGIESFNLQNEDAGIIRTEALISRKLPLTFVFPENLDTEEKDKMIFNAVDPVLIYGTLRSIHMHLREREVLSSYKSLPNS